MFDRIITFFLIPSGIATFLGALHNHAWLMNNNRVQWMIDFFGVTATRIFYMFIGLVLTVISTLGLLGIIPMHK
jgi:hypothetical protein